MTTQRDMTKSKAGVNAARVQAALVCLTACLLGGGSWFGSATASAQEPYEVIVYEQPNFAGQHVSFRLDPKLMRQRLVPCYEGGDISSIQVGSKVGVALFPDPNFQGKDAYGALEGYFPFRGSVTTVSGLPALTGLGYPCRSLIVFAGDVGQPLGVRLMYKWDEFRPGYGTFLPLPESLSETARKYRVLPEKPRWWAIDASQHLSISGNNTQVTLWEQPDYQGNSITLPGASITGPYEKLYNLNGYFGAGASSLEVRWLVPGAWSGVKVVPKGALTQLEVIPVPAKPSMPDISGKWDSNTGHIYQMTQNGNQFSWFAAAINQNAAGTVSGKGMSASWQGPGGTGSANGTITQVDPGGRGTRIEWDNGAVLFRQGTSRVTGAKPAGDAPAPPGPQSGVANISGTWNSSLGTVYQITQTGSQFNWFAASINQQAAGTVSGKGVSASWQAPGPGSAKGNITQIDPAGTATRIDWDNGVVFTRKSAPPALPGPPAGGLPAPPGQQAPGPQGWVLEDMTDRPGMDIKVFSLNGSVDDCMKACQSDPNCKAFTYFGPEQGPQARCHLKSGVPAPVKAMSLSAVRPSQQAPPQQGWPQPAPPQPPTAPPVTPNAPDVSGTWNSSIGVVYEITQSGSQFNWYAATLKQNGSGTLAGKDMSASWSDAGGSGSAKGKIAVIDGNGRATRIDWDNGVVFYR